MNLNWVKIVAIVIAIWGVLGLVTHPSLISLLMVAGGGYVAWTGDLKFAILRAKVKDHFQNKDQ